MSTDREILDILGTDARLHQALANVGVDLACGACAIAFFTGVGLPGDPGHTCGRVMYCATCRCTCGRFRQPLAPRSTPMKRDDEIVEKHPSYATIRIHRTTGGRPRLFGSPITDHRHTIRISIAAAERVHSLGYDRYHSSCNRPIMQVEMSAAQFAELITTVNSDETPCTLRIREGVRVEDPPDDVKVEADLVREKFTADVKAAMAELQPAVAAVEAILAKKSLTNADRTAAHAALHQFVRLIGDMAPFMLSQFEEATQRITTTAKIEVDAFMTSVIVAAGLKAINEQGLDAVPDDMRPALPAPKGETP